MFCRIIFILCSIGLTINCTINRAEAKDRASDEISPQALGISIGIVDEVVSVNFEPYKILLLEESGIGELRQLRSWYAPTDAMTGTGNNKRELLIGAPISLSLKNDNVYRYTFFLASREGDFIATPIREVSAINIKNNSLTISEMKRQAKVAEKHAQEIEEKIADTDERLSMLRTQASEIANLDELAELKMRLFGLQMSEDKKSAEKAHLKELIEINQGTVSSNAVSNAALDATRFALSQQLRELVIQTRGLTNSGASKEEIIKKNFLKKLALVRQAEGVNPEELRAAIERLKARRLGLESELGIR